MKKITPQNLHASLPTLLDRTDFISVFNALLHFLRRGGEKQAAQRFNMLLQALAADKTLCARLGNRLHVWLSKIHIYPALVGLGIFSRSGFAREFGMRVYERFFPSFKNFNNLRDVFLYLFYSQQDTKWLKTIPATQWLKLYRLLRQHTEPNHRQAAYRHITQARLHALEMLSIWIAAEELEPEFIRLEPKLMEVESAFVALHHEVSKLVEHYRQVEQLETFDIAHIEVMLAQCRQQVERLRRKGTGAGAGSSVKVAHLLERLSQTLDRLTLLLHIQTRLQPTRHTLQLLHSLTQATIEQHSTILLRERSIKMLARSITENTSGRGEHYITHNRWEYLSMLLSAAGGGVIIAFMALNKIHIGNSGWGEFTTAFLGGLNYGLGFMLIHMLHCTVATKQPAMTAAYFAEQVGQTDKGRAVNNKLAKLLIDVVRSQSVAVFGNVSVAIIVAASIAATFAYHTHQPLLSADNVAYQFKSIAPFTQPTLLYAAIAGFWLFCSGIISGFFDNRAAYINLRQRLAVQPLLQKILPLRIRLWLGDYLHRNYGALAGNFIFGMLLGMTGYVGHLLGLPLDIRHVAFSSANLGYAAVSGEINFFLFLLHLISVLLIGLVNLWVSFSLALAVALRARDARIDSLSQLLHSIWTQIKAHPLNLIFPVQAASQVIKDNKPNSNKG